MRISFLHTMDGNRQVFEQAAKTLGMRAEELQHEVRADLREAVDQAGTFSDELRAQTNPQQRLSPVESLRNQRPFAVQKRQGVIRGHRAAHSGRGDILRE